MSKKPDKPKFYLGQENLKASGVKINWTEEQVQEYMKCKDDPLYFIQNYIYIISLDHGLVKFKPHDFQVEFMDLCVNNRFVIAKWPRQQGKQLCIETPIMTPNGFVPLGDLKVGDTLYGPDGKPANISFITETTYASKAYEVVFDNGDVIKACEDHLWEVHCTNWSTRINGEKIKGQSKVLRTADIIPYLEKVNKPYIKFTAPLDMPTKELPIDPYQLGIWLGDGHSADGRVTCHVDDLEHYKTRFDVQHVGCHESRPNIAQFNTGLFRQLRLNGLLGKKHIPADYLTASFDQRLELLKGLMDTDGSVQKPKGDTCEFYQKDEALVDDVRTLLASLGIKSRKRPKTINDVIYWTVTFRPSFVVFDLPRKVALQKFDHDHPKNSRLYITEIREVESVPMRCLQVDNENHLFLAGSTLIPTHNTTTTAALLLWYVLFNKHFKIALLAHKEEQAREILGRVQLAFENLPFWLQQGIVTWNKGDIEFENGSMIKTYATSSGSIRGKSYNIVYLDEFAHIEPNVQEEFFTSTYPTISSGKTTRFIITSTPKGMELFYKTWHDSEQGRNDFKRHEAFWWQMPGRDEAWKAETIKNTSEWQFNQEFNTEFLGSTNTLIDGQKLKTLTYDYPISEMGNIAFFKKAEKGHVYVLAVDCSEGLNQDYHAASVIDVTKTPYEVCAVYHDNKTHHLMVPNIIYNLAKLYNDAMVMIETQSTGSQVATILLHDLEYEGVLSTTLKGKTGQRIGGGFGGEVRLGVMMNQQVKRIGCTNLKALIEQDKLIFHDERILKEFFTFTADKKTFRADEGKNDDLVMSLVIFAWMVAQNFFKDVTDTDVRRDIYQENVELIEQDLTPFGFIDDGQDDDDPVHVGYF